MPDVAIETECITLVQALKWANVAENGAQASAWVREGLVKVNGEVCLQRGKKLRPKDSVESPGGGFVLTAALNAAQ